jgi:hypothetical protein
MRRYRTHTAISFRLRTNLSQPAFRFAVSHYNQRVKYEFASSNTTRPTFAFDACFVWKLAPLADEQSGFFIENPSRRLTQLSTYYSLQTRTWPIESRVSTCPSSACPSDRMPTAPHSSDRMRSAFAACVRRYATFVDLEI